MTFKYDALITKLAKDLGNKNDLMMDREDILQYGRMEVIKALKKYDKKRGVKQITFIYTHLYKNFGNLFYKSVKHKFLGYKKDLKNIIKSGSYEKKMSSKTIDWESTDLTYELDFDNIEFKIYIEKMCQKSNKFQLNWEKYKTLQEKINEINIKINKANSKNSGGINLLVETKNKIFEKMEKIEKSLKYLVEKDKNENVSNNKLD